jgi:hypothetical protein
MEEAVDDEATKSCLECIIPSNLEVNHHGTTTTSNNIEIHQLGCTRGGLGLVQLVTRMKTPQHTLSWAGD